MKNEKIEALFEDFLYSAPTWELAEAMHRLSAQIDRQIAAGDVDADLIGEYELSALRYGFFAGVAAGMKYRQQGAEA